MVSMRVTSLLVLATATVPATHAFIAWSGDACNGAKGADVGLDGACHQFGGRHSFVAGATACVKFYTLSNCSGERFTYTNQGSQCTNVNTGRNIEAFRAWPGATSCPQY